MGEFHHALDPRNHFMAGWTSGFVDVDHPVFDLHRDGSFFGFTAVLGITRFFHFGNESMVVSLDSLQRFTSLEVSLLWSLLRKRHCLVPVWV